jgi:phenylpropionate dioxygenase-like ring-hydroxylating dioxygenase large terminal subunit
MAFVLNAWYVVAWPHEVVSDKVLARTVCDNAMVLWRSADGTVNALEDRCPHREMPMRLGLLEPNGLRCSYHGLLFATDGRCIEIPGQDVRISAGLQIRRYPTVEKYGWIWVWPGDAAQADPNRVPAMYAHNDRTNVALEGRVAHFKANYLMLVENLLDLTHEPHLHPTSLGNAAVFESPPEQYVEDDGVRVERWMLNKIPSPFWVKLVKAATGYEGPCDRWQKIFFEPPSSIYLDVGAGIPDGRARSGDKSNSAWLTNNHFITPETEKSVFDFWSIASNCIEPQVLKETADYSAATIFVEDGTALAGCQEVMDRHPGRPFYSIPTDKAGLGARRLVDQLLAAEKNARSRAS